LVSSKPTGTLVLRDVRPGKRLFMLATGTGVAPFLGLIKDPGDLRAIRAGHSGARRARRGDLAMPIR
jgi:ferredoxin-NADP reductase